MSQTRKLNELDDINENEMKDDKSNDADNEMEDDSPYSVNNSQISSGDWRIQPSEYKQVRIKRKRPSEPDYKSRLFICEGTFSYVTSVLKKHEDNPDEVKAKRGLGKSFVATELKSEAKLVEEKGFSENVSYARSKGVTLLFEKDVANLPTDPEIRKLGRSDGTFSDIHCSFPYASNASTTKNLVSTIFKSACQLQKAGDHIHMVLVQTQNIENVSSNTYWWHSEVYSIQTAANAMGYEYVQKRKFLNPAAGYTRYPHYSHAVTDPNGSSSKTVKAFGGREFIFRKTSQSLPLNNGKMYKDFGKKLLGLIPLNTDSDSSSYEEECTSSKRLKKQ